VGTPVLPRRCDVRAEYGSRLGGYPSERMGDGALYLDLFEQSGQKRVFQQRAEYFEILPDPALLGYQKLEARGRP